jgi:putative membrane protein
VADAATKAELKIGDRLALDRTRMAADRTLMAWVRTALSLISFGFTIYKFLQALQDQSTVAALRPNAPRNVGLTLVGMGTAALVVACVQYRRHLRTLGSDPTFKLFDLTLTVAVLLVLVGILMFGGILFHNGPFG